MPDETGGPFPGDGGNGVDVLDDTGIVRRDIRRGFGGASGVARGIPMRIDLTVTNAARRYAPIAGAAVYFWHCDRDGAYSLYSAGLEDENYLRGVARTDARGVATVQSIFPGCDAGRWPHVHFEVYRSVRAATRNGPIVKTSQIALPAAACRAAYATSGYASSRRNLAGTSIASDNVFGDDGARLQTATVRGNPRTGYVASLVIGV